MLYCSQRKMRMFLPDNSSETDEIVNLVQGWVSKHSNHPSGNFEAISDKFWLRIRYYHGEGNLWLDKETTRAFGDRIEPRKDLIYESKSRTTSILFEVGLIMSYKNLLKYERVRERPRHGPVTGLPDFWRNGPLGASKIKNMTWLVQKFTPVNEVRPLRERFW